MIAQPPLCDNHPPPPLSPLLLDALAPQLAAAGITASADALLRHLNRKILVSRPDLSRGAHGPRS